MNPYLENPLAPPRRPRQDKTPGPEWRRSPSGVWLPPFAEEMAECGASVAAVGGAHRALVPSFPATPFVHFSGEAANFNSNNDGSGSAPSLAGDLVRRWVDTSGNARHLNVSQGSPSYEVPSGNSRGSVRFDTGEQLARASTGLSGAQTWALSFKLDATPGSGAFGNLFTLSDGGAGTFGELWVANSGSYRPLYWRLGYTQGSAGNGVGIAVTLDTSWHTLLITYDGVSSTTASSYTAYYDGSVASVIASGSNSGTAGSSMLLGRNPSFTTASQFRVVSVYARALSAGDIALWHAAAAV